MLSRVLHDTHLGSNLDTAKRAVTCTVARFDIYGVHIIFLVVVLAEKLRAASLATGCGHVGDGGSVVGGVAVVAVCREELGEDAADNWS
jgi:hypothetical protein